MFLGSIVFILVLFVLPVLLLREKIIPHRYRFFIIDAAALVILGYILLNGWSFVKLGFSFKTITTYIRPYVVIAISCLIVLLVSAKYFFNLENFKTRDLLHINPVFAITSVVQEFLFRSFLLTYQLEIGMEFTLAIITNAILFMFMHIIYATDRKILMFIFLSGLLFATTYFFFPNFFLISILHILFNHIVVVLFGIFRSENATSKKRVSFRKKKAI